jgi:FAD:protein FMN transferase
MNAEREPGSNRREFLSGRALRRQVEQAGDLLADAIVETASAEAIPMAGDTIRLSTRAMACDWSVVLNPGPAERIMIASDALDLVHSLEAQMTVYRDESELSQTNSKAFHEPVTLERNLFELLDYARRISLDTQRAFDPTSGPLIDLWRRSRNEGRVPNSDEIEYHLGQTGIEHVRFDEKNLQVSFEREGLRFDLGAIGKGYAVDKAGEFLVEHGAREWLVHGGMSSILARGDHNGLGGWPVGIRNPLLPHERVATILLKDQAMASSGSNVQYFRHGGQRYGHILDPRTGWPAERLLSVTVLAPNAATADALSTAFFVAGVEKSRDYCDNHEGVGALLIPRPESGKRLEPVLLGISEETLFLS